MQPTVRGLFALACAVATVGVAAGCGGGASGRKGPPTLRGHVVAIDYQADPGAVVAVGFFDVRRGVLATARGARLLTADGGRTWRRAGRLKVTTIEPVSRTVAFAVGRGRLLRTDDAGRHWRRVGRASGTLSFADDRHGWFAGRRLLGTEDGGRTVHAVRSPCPSHGPRANVYEGYSRVSARLGYAACGGSPGAGSQRKDLLVTEDGGRRWRRVAGADPPGVGYLVDITFTDRHHGFMTTQRGGTWETRDGGRHWRSLLGPEVDVMSDPQRLDSRSVVALLRGALVRTRGGGTWQALYPASLPPPELRSPTTTRAMIGIGPGDWNYGPTIAMATSDGGRSWQPRGALPDGIDAIRSLVRGSPAVAYAVADGPPDRGGELLLRTPDDGRTWDRLSPPSTQSPYRVAFTSADHGLLSDRLGAVYATVDGGRTWTQRRLRGASLESFAMFDDERGIALAGRVGVQVTDDGGRTWRRPAESPARSPLGLAVLAPNHAWILDQSDCPPGRRAEDDVCQAIVRTKDRGDTWQRIELDRPLDPSLSGAAPIFTSPREGSTAWHRTSDGGRTWRPATSLTTP